MGQTDRVPARTLWVNHLATFVVCPQQYYLKHVRKLRGRFVAHPNMTRGLIAHQVLAGAFNEFRHRRAFPAGLRAQIQERVSGSRDIDRSARDHETGLINGYVDAAIETFDRRATVHTVERAYGYLSRGRGAGQPFTLKSRVDLVVVHEDGEVEHVDWKTGKRSDADQRQLVASRVAVGSDIGAQRVRSTVAYLTLGERDSRVLTRDEAQAGWSDIRAIALDIETCHQTGHWQPIMSNHCARCPFYGSACVLHRQRVTRGS